MQDARTEAPGEEVQPLRAAASAAATADPLEAALLLAAEAGRFDVVAQIAKELEARRLAGSATVVPIARGRRP